MATIAPDFTVRRKKLYKKKYAPNGSLYLVIRTTHNGTEFTSAKQIWGSMPRSMERAIANNLYMELAKKHNLPYEKANFLQRLKSLFMGFFRKLRNFFKKK